MTTPRELIARYATQAQMSSFFIDKMSIFNVKSYGAKGDGATDDTTAIQDAVTAADGAIVFFPPGNYRYSSLTMPINTVLWGAGRENTILTYTGSTIAIDLPQGSARCQIRDLSLWGNNVGTGLSYDGSYFNHVENVAIWQFATGVEFNNAAVFTARNSLKNFEVNSCKNGITALSGSNINVIDTGRIWNITDGGNGIGLNINSAHVLKVCGVNIESCDTCLKIDGADTIVSFDACYLEAGVGNVNYNIINYKKLYGNIYTSGMGMSIKAPLDNLADFSGPTTYSGATPNAATAAVKNYIKNGDFSRGNQYWGLNTGLTTSEDAADYVVGNKSLTLTPGGASPTLSNLSYSFTVKNDVKAVAVMVRFKNLSSTDFKINVINNAVTYQYISAAVSSDWEVATVLCEVSSTNRVVIVRLYPDATLGTGQVKVDSVWVVDGRCAAPFRHYHNAVELLPTFDTIFSGTTTSNIADAARASTKIPYNAIGMVLEVSIKATLAETYDAYVTINGTPIYAFRNNKETVVEHTVNGTSVTSGVVVTNSSNSVTYSVKIKSWILE